MKKFNRRRNKDKIFKLKQSVLGFKVLLSYDFCTMNEMLFFIQIFLILSFTLGALKLGQSALVAWVAIQALIANLFVLKQITLFGFEVTASDAFVIGSLLGLNFLQEFYSKEEANRATWICFFSMFFFALISRLHLYYEPSLHDTSQIAFQTILSPSPRIFMASMSVFFIVQQFDMRFFSWLKNRLPNLSFSFRTAMALLISQFLDTFLFSFVGLYGLVASVFDIIVISYLIKLIVVFCFTSIIRLVKA